MLEGTYRYNFFCGPCRYSINVTIHSFEQNNFASVAEISWVGKEWRFFFEWLRGKRFGFNPETKTWKVQCCELFYNTIADGFTLDSLAKDGFIKI